MIYTTYSRTMVVAALILKGKNNIILFTTFHIML